MEGKGVGFPKVLSSGLRHFTDLIYEVIFWFFHTNFIFVFGFSFIFHLFVTLH